MRIGTITFHRAANYGAVLQAFALIYTLRKIGVDAEIIDYRCPFIEDYYDTRKILTLRNWKRIASYILFNGTFFPKREELYFDFLMRKKVLSKEIYYKSCDLNRTNLLYDCYFTGSDQIWNYKTAGFDKSYFLDFVNENNKKNSYAASFGVSSIPSSKKLEYSNLLNSFNTISVRENIGIELIHDLLGIDARVDLDPTLLIDKDEWASLIDYIKIRKLVRGNSQGYILIYLISEDQHVFDTARAFAKKSNLPIIYINNKWRKHRDIINLSNINIDEWLFLFLNATYVLTDSFHGTAFACNFNKKFLTFQLPNSHFSSRINSLLDNLGIEHRLFQKEVLDFNVISNQESKEYIVKLINLRTNSLEHIKGVVQRYEIQNK